MSRRDKEDKLKILLLEDDKYVLTMMEDLVSMKGYTTRSAHAPFEALHILDSEHIDLIVSDIRMPGMSGIEFGLKIRRQGNTVPIIYYSGEVDAKVTYHEELQEMGDNVTVFHKDVTFTDVTEKITECLKTRERISSPIHLRKP